MPTLKLSLGARVRVSDQMDQDIIFLHEEEAKDIFLTEEGAKEQDSGPTLRASSDSIPAHTER
jgi:hypothetical protein